MRKEKRSQKAIKDTCRVLDAEFERLRPLLNSVVLIELERKLDAVHDSLHGPTAEEANTKVLQRLNQLHLELKYIAAMHNPANDNSQGITPLWQKLRTYFSPSKGKTRRTRPPKRAEKLLYLLLPKEWRDSLPGDLEEEYKTIISPKFGRRYARLWYWKQVLVSIWRILPRRIMGLAAVAWMGKVAHWLFSKFGT